MLLPTADAQAATCSDYSNQADAQRAKDTRDADGDGIYCESLPCPCLEPGQSSSPTPSPTPQTKPRRKTRVFRGARITSVADGDTIRVRLANGRYERVRLIGIDTPETKDPGTPVECGGPHATGEMLRLAFTEPEPEDSDGDGLLDTAGGEGRSVTLRTDPTARRADSLKESQLAAGRDLLLSAGHHRRGNHNSKPRSSSVRRWRDRLVALSRFLARGHSAQRAFVRSARVLGCIGVHFASSARANRRSLNDDANANARPSPPGELEPVGVSHAPSDRFGQAHERLHRNPLARQLSSLNGRRPARAPVPRAHSFR